MSETKRLEEAAADGAAFLDEHHPGWWKQIDPDDLELNDCSRCVIGQLLGSFNDTTVCQVIASAADMYDPVVSRLGFTVGGEMDVSDPTEYHKRCAQYDHLTDAWKREIAKRAGAPAIDLQPAVAP